MMIIKLSPVKKQSAWQFVTSSTGGIGALFVAAEGGRIYMNDPQGSLKSFTFGTVGAGLSVGLKLPKIGKLKIGGNVAPAWAPNAGVLYILDDFENDELEHDDITGVCALVEVGGGLVVGGSSTAILLGMHVKWAAACNAAGVCNFDPVQRLMGSARALLLMAGVNAGIQAGAGVIGCTGYLG